MARYRKKYLVEAEQFWPNQSQWPEGIFKKGDSHFINTLEGVMSVVPGAWVITGPKGERYACDPEIFTETYEIVEE